MLKYLNSVNVKGIIQVGSNLGQEVPIFKKYTQNIILIEPIHSLVKLLKKHYPNYLVIETALGIENTEKDLYIASNRGGSSSLLKPDQHLTLHPWVKFKTTQKVKVRRFDTLAKNLKINMDLYNVVMTDTQGCDLDVLKSFGVLLKYVDLIISEYMDIELYIGNQGLSLFTEYLKDFELIDRDHKENYGGNAVFKRKQ